MFEYEIQQNRHAALVAEADQARLARTARQARKAAAPTSKLNNLTHRVTSLRDHFTHAA
ncbi:hypothetical protein [Streptomyces sp. NPDC051561]|uniref:hypothetical protein n=1 Tax=Streptomyces sp. NPDC051561 TaxID=3365658 RepID=UPI0037A132DF